MTALLRLSYLFAVVATAASAFLAPRAPPGATVKTKTGTFAAATDAPAAAVSAMTQKAFAAAAASAGLAFVLAGAPLQADAATSRTAGQISLNSIPPTSVKVDVRDLPVIGDVLSGTYTRVGDGDVKGSPPSVSIKSPKDKVGAIRDAATGGHLEFDVDGLVSTHVDVDVAADEAGVLTARVTSPLVPKLPFKNGASSGGGVDGGSATSSKGGRASDWNAVTNLGDGKVYYFNSRTDETTYMKPSKI